jgi:hypothetical protein
LTPSRPAASAVVKRRPPLPSAILINIEN